MGVSCYNFPMPSYADIIAKEIHDAGFSYGEVQAIVDGKLIWVVDASKDGQKYIAQAETQLTAYLNLQNMLKKSKLRNDGQE